jgi:nitrate reductase alpha subunit
MGGRLNENKDVVREFLAVDVATGVYPPDFTYEQWEKDGYARVVGMGAGIQGTAPANEMSADKPFYSFAAHVDDKRVYPTLTRRAQFYMDHDWFIEAGEALPAHKDTPPVGGMHPFRITSGHPRISVHTLHQAVPFLMKLHRAQPVVFMNDQKATEMGIKDGDMVRVFNDLDSAELMASLSAGVAPDQIVIYMFDGFQFKDWKSHDALLIGMPKPTHLAMDYGQLRFQFLQGSPAPTSDRGLRVDVQKV